MKRSIASCMASCASCIVGWACHVCAYVSNKEFMSLFYLLPTLDLMRSKRNLKHSLQNLLLETHPALCSKTGMQSHEQRQMTVVVLDGARRMHHVIERRHFPSTTLRVTSVVVAHEVVVRFTLPKSLACENNITEGERVHWPRIACQCVVKHCSRIVTWGDRLNTA